MIQSPSVIDHRMKTYLLLLSLAIGLSACKEKSVTYIDQPIRPWVQSLFAINGDRRVTLGWTPARTSLAKHADDGNGHLPPAELSAILIYRSDDADFLPTASTLLQQLAPTLDRYTDSNLTNEFRYYYRMVAVASFPDGSMVLGEPSGVAVGRPFDYSTVTTISFADHIQPIFLSGCAVSGCHVGTSNHEHGNTFPKGSDHPESSQFSLQTWEDILRGGPHGAVVVPYTAMKSHIVFHTNTDTLVAPVSLPHMPRPGFNLPPDQIQTVIRWINEGAQNEFGAIAFTRFPQGSIFATNQSEDFVSIIDIATNLVARFVKVGNASGSIVSAPHHVRVDRNGNYFYVTLINSNELWKFSAGDYRFIAKLSIPPSPADVILTSTGDTAIVTHFSPLSTTPARIVTLVNTSTMQIIRTINLPFSLQPFVSFPHGALLSADGGKLYLTNQGSGNITQINLTDDSIQLIALDTSSAITSNTEPYLADQSRDGRFIYASGYGTNDIRIIDLQLDSTRAFKAVPVGVRPLHVKVTPDGEYVVSANQGSDDVTFVRTSDFSTSTITNVGRQPHGIEFSPDGTLMYITCENRTEAIPPHHPTQGNKQPAFISVIDMATRQVIRQIEVGGFAAGISVGKQN